MSIIFPDNSNNKKNKKNNKNDNTKESNADRNVLAFSASMRSEGNSDTLLDHVIGRIERTGGVSVTKYRTAELAIQPCRGCGACEKKFGCVVDGPFQDLIGPLTEADGIIFATPLYFMNVPAAGKALIDRLQMFWAAKYFRNEDVFGGRNRPGILIAVSGSEKGPGGSPIFRGLQDTMNYAFDALNVDIAAQVSASGVDEKGAIYGHPHYFDVASDAADTFLSKLLFDK